MKRKMERQMERWLQPASPIGTFCSVVSYSVPAVAGHSRETGISDGFAGRDSEFRPVPGPARPSFVPSPFQRRIPRLKARWNQARGFSQGFSSESTAAANVSLYSCFEGVADSIVRKGRKAAGEMSAPGHPPGFHSHFPSKRKSCACKRKSWKCR